jgi:acyl-CoA synthetase (AMP-forming)/AMP-acid ligase II
MRQDATFSLFVRKLPRHRSFLVAAGLEDVLGFLRQFQFSEAAVRYVRSLGGFDREFLDFLADVRFTGTVRAVPEGTVVFGDEPLLEVTAPIIEAQLVETAVLNFCHLQTLLASKAVRSVLAARGQPIVDFGLRRTHGIDAGLKAARAAFIVGVGMTSNVLAGLDYEIPPAGTMAQRVGSARAEDVASIVYTSGTTGEPKGVVQTHANHLAMLRALAQLPGVQPGDVHLLFLPLAHSFARVEAFMAVHRGLVTAFAEGPSRIGDNLREVRPHFIFGIPRVFEKARDRIVSDIETRAALTRDVFAWAMGIGRLDADGFLAITDRKKEMIVTSTGLNIALRHVERLLKRDPLVGEAMVYGDRRPYLVALVALAPDALAAFAGQRGIRNCQYAELARDPEVVDRVERDVQAANAELQSYAQVKRFAVTPAPLTEEGGELTPTQKVKRRVVAERYRELIEALYR